MSWKPNLFYEVYITNKSPCGHGYRCRKPVPWKESRKEKEDIILHLNSHKYLKGDKKNKGEENWI